MTDLLIHPSTQILIDTYLKRPAHGLLLAGPTGVGLGSIARYIASHTGDNPTTQEVTPDEKGTITIDVIRRLYQLTRTHRDTALTIMIDNAEAMGREAQNALLKLLEEPVAHVHFILTSHAPQTLLPTVTSRVQRIDVLPVSKEESTALITADTESGVRAQLLFVASGLPAELIRLQSDAAYFTHKMKQMKDARSFLESDAYSRLVLIKEYGADRVSATEFLDAIAKLLTFMLLSKQDPSLVSSLLAVENTSGRLRQNAHVRTQLTYLVTQL